MPLDPENDETVALGTTRTPVPNAQRFAPGTLLASRYRIVSRLGKGGMGEVFRADDIMLGQPVALKFLPENAARNINLLTRFYDEVRIARQISHANVCRVYDIGEIDGQPYLSMEYIDGEDLSSLLRRIGRLPGDKAAEFARKMCAGLAAAHAQGVLHRDIKPGNIMIDGRGEPRITDFGLAAVAASIEGNEIRNGTPAYMAPEQLEGREVTVQSDLYALGLVFHEMFTGKAAHDAQTVAELTRIRKETRTTKASTLVADLDPAVDRAIQACLDPDPKMRPKSALELARMLPGGDPLAAALAAGQTPSPEMVAAAGEEGALRPWVALLLAGGIAVALALAVWLGAHVQVVNHIPLELPPDVLEAKARDIARNLGYTQTPVDSQTGFQFSRPQMSRLWGKGGTRDQWIATLSMPPQPLAFWYRESPAPLVAENMNSNGLVNPGDPSQAIAGMVNVVVAVDGRLLAFNAVPPEVQKDAPFGQSMDWKPLFDAAKLDMDQFVEAQPNWTPLAATDVRAAWTGKYPAKDEIPIRVEAAAFQNRAVYFAIIFPWTGPNRTVAGLSTSTRSEVQLAYTLVLVLIGLVACTIARRNWQTGRSDTRGATRIAVYVFSLTMVGWLLRTHHVATAAEQTLWFEALAEAAGSAGAFWVVYLALEPWVRRYWPQSLITWSRVMSGRWNDPMVGRDILFSIIAGLAYGIYVLALITGDTMSLGDFQPGHLLGIRRIASSVAGQLVYAISESLQYFMLLFLLRVLLRKQIWASIAFVLIYSTYRALVSGGDVWWLNFLAFAVIYAIYVALQMRLGLLALVVTQFVFMATISLIATTNLSSWYGQSTWVLIALLAGLTAWGVRLAIGKQQLWSDAALER